MVSMSHRKSPAWHRYQEQARDFFRSLGLAAECDIHLDGARGGDNFDVVADGVWFGVRIRWVAECKYWKRNVSKGEARKFRDTVQNVGADRGFLFSEKGFQAGAVAATSNTNVTLTSLEEVKGQAKAELRWVRLAWYRGAMEDLARRLHALSVVRSEPAAPGTMSITSRQPPDFMLLFGKVVICESSLRDIKYGSPYLPYCGPDGLLVFVADEDEIFRHADELLTEGATYIEKYKDWPAQVAAEGSGWQRRVDPTRLALDGIEGAGADVLRSVGVRRADKE